MTDTSTLSETRENSRYPASYGSSYSPAKPDFNYCCSSVWDRSTRWPRSYQCTRARGFGPDKAYCKQHDPEAAKKRQEATDLREKELWDKRKVELSGALFLKALRTIADGHNDPRALATETIASFEKGRR